MSAVIIPARYGSTRFPGKVLADIDGRPMIVRVAEQAVQTSADKVIVVTDNEKVYEVCSNIDKVNVMMSPSDLSTGTDRVAFAAKNIDDDIIINVQGDEPFIQPQQVESLIACFDSPQVQIATLAKQFENNGDIFDPNKVKVVCSAQGTALYFSRSAIPFCRGVEQEEWVSRAPFYKHVGMYAYRSEVLREITALPPGMLEQCESLEQLRWLEQGYTIAVRLTDHESIGIDTPEDLQRANEAFKER